MATTTVKYGSQGSDVSTLQNMLNAAGYNLTVDGIFGSATQNAVKQYQQAAGLTADGIVGTNTWGALNSGGSSGTASGTSTFPTSTGDSAAVSYSGTAENPSYTYDQLLASLQRGSSYTPYTNAQIAEMARNQYDPIYNQNVLSAQQSEEKQRLALEQQLAALQPTYDKQREAAAETYANAYSQAGRQSLSRGMQRSSYNNATLSNINLAGAKTQNEIGEAQAQAENSINQNISLNSQQLAQYLQQLQNDYATNVAAYQDAIRDKDYERANAAAQYANQVEMELYQLGLQQQQYSVQQQQWEKEFAEQQRQFNASLAKSGGSGGGSGSSGVTAGATTTGSTTSDWLNNLFATGNTVANKVNKADNKVKSTSSLNVR